MAIVINGNGIDMGNNPVSNASQIDGTVIVISETTWDNPDGVEYADSGIQGVPNTSFSSTGARIYPDGTIRGKSSYGEYVKYPDGTLVCTRTIVAGTSISYYNANNNCIFNLYTAHKAISTFFGMSATACDGYTFSKGDYILSLSNGAKNLGWDVLYIRNVKETINLTSLPFNIKLQAIGEWK